MTVCQLSNKMQNQSGRIQLRGHEIEVLKGKRSSVEVSKIYCAYYTV